MGVVYPVKAVIYCRVSTVEQSTENQIPVLTAWGNQLRFNDLGFGSEPLELGEIYQEQETAWRLGHQRELSRLLIDASRGRFKAVLVWALDRLTRQGIQAQFEIMSKLSRFGVSVYSYQEPWTLTPTKVEYDLLLAIAAYISHSSSQRNSERTKAGLARAIREGRTKSGKPFLRMGRPPGSKDKTQRKRRRAVIKI